MNAEQVGHRECDVLLQGANGLDADAHAGLDLKLGDAWFDQCVVDVGIDGEAIEGLLRAFFCASRVSALMRTALVRSACWRSWMLGRW